MEQRSCGCSQFWHSAPLTLAVGWLSAETSTSVPAGFKLAPSPCPPRSFSCKDLVWGYPGQVQGEVPFITMVLLILIRWSYHIITVLLLPLFLGINNSNGITVLLLLVLLRYCYCFETLRPPPPSPHRKGSACLTSPLKSERK